MKVKKSFSFIIFLMLSIVCGVLVFQTKNVNLVSANTDNEIVWDFTQSATKNESFGFSGGDGTSDNPYLIMLQQDFATLLINVNSGIKYEDTYFRLEKDIRFYSDEDFNNKDAIDYLDSLNAIGNNDANYFAGSFNGNNKTIYNLKIKSDMYTGLFGNVKGTSLNRASIKNLTINNFYLIYNTDKTTNNIGVLAGKIEYCDITNCKILENSYDLTYFHKTNKAFVGGAVGSISSIGDSSLTNVSCNLNISITNSQSTNITKSSIDDYSIIGGLIGDCGGQDNTKIVACSFNGDITQLKTNDLALSVGGLIGRSKKTSVINCYASGNLNFNNNVFVGGIAGFVNNEITINNCFAYFKNFDTNAQTNYNITIGQYNKVATNPIPKGVDIQNFYCLENQNKEIIVNVINSSPNDLPDYVSQTNLNQITEDDFKNQSSFSTFDFENVWNMGENHPILQNYSQFKVTLYANNSTEESKIIYLDNSSNVLDLQNFNQTFEYGDNIFLGWDENINSSNPTYSESNDNLSITITKNTNLYAIWQVRYIVSVYHNNNTEDVTNYDVTNDNALNLQNVIDLIFYENHFAIGFGLDKTDTEPQFVTSDIITTDNINSSLNLFVLWKENYKVVLHFNSNTADKTLYFTDSNNSLNLQDFSSDEYIKDDYILMGWNTDNSDNIEYQTDEIITVAKSFDLYAVCKEVFVKVTENNVTTNYSDLTTAFNKVKSATSNVKVEIIKDLTLQEDLEINLNIDILIKGKDKNIILNTNGHSIKSVTRNNINITIEAITLNNSQTNGNIVIQNSNANFVLTNVNLTSASLDEVIKASGSLLLDNCNIQSSKSSLVKIVDNTITIKGGKYLSSQYIVNLGYNSFLILTKTATFNADIADVLISEPSVETASINIQDNITNQVSVEVKNVSKGGKYAIFNCITYTFNNVELKNLEDWHFVKINNIWYITDVYESYLNKNFLSKIQIDKNKIENITFTNNALILENGISVGSLDENGEQDFVDNFGLVDVTCYVLTNKNNNYDLTFYSPATIYAPTNSSSLFSNLTNLQTIIFNNLSFAKSNNISSLFYNCESIKELDLLNFDFTLTKTTLNMFEGMTNLRKIISPLNVNETTMLLPTNLNFYEDSDSSFSNKVLEINQNIQGSHLVVAFNLNLNAGSGTFDGNDTTFEYNSNNNIATKMIGYDSYVINSLPLPNKLGFDFVEWKDELTNNSINLPFEICEDMQLIAVFTEKEFTISYNANGGVGFVDNEVVKYGQEVIINNGQNIQKQGYTLVQWKTASGQVYDLNQKFNYYLNKDLYLLADFTPISYTVVFNSNNGLNEKISQNFVYDNQQTLQANSFSYSGFKFKGWSLSQDPNLDGEIDFENNQLINSENNISDKQGAVVNLYAVWIVKTDTNFTVKYYVQDLNLTDYIERQDLMETLSGLTNSVVKESDIEIKNIMGFEKSIIKYFKKDEEVSSPIIFGEEDLIIKVFYDRKEFNLNLIASTSSVGGGANGGEVSFDVLTNPLITTTKIKFEFTQSFYVQANKGYVVKNISLENGSYNYDEINSCYVISNITDNATITVEFELIKFNVILDNSNSNGAISFASGYLSEVYYGNDVVIESVANSGYNFKEFIVKDKDGNELFVKSDNPLTINSVKQDLVISASYIKMYVVKINYQNSNGLITNLIQNDYLSLNESIVSGKAYYIAENTNLSLLISPNSNYYHVNVIQINNIITKAIDNNDNTKTLNYVVVSDTEINVEIDIEKYVINFYSNIENISTLTMKKDGVVDNSPTVAFGTNITLQSSVNDNGYQLTGWLVKQNDSFTYLLDQNNNKITANSINFVADKDFEIMVQYKIEINIQSSINGTIRASLLNDSENVVTNGIILALPNEHIQVVAQADFGYYLVNYTNEEFKVDLDSGLAPNLENVLVVTKPVTISGIFSSKQVEIRLMSNNGEIKTDSLDKTKFVIGDEITFTAESDYGYKFKSWAISYSGSTYNGVFNSIINPQTYVVTPQDVESGVIVLQANFELITYKVFVISNISSFVQLSGANLIDNYYQLDNFSELLIKITPEFNYRLKNFYVTDLQQLSQTSLIDNLVNNQISIKVSEDSVINIEFCAITWLDDNVRANSFYGGSGSQSDPFIISNARELGLMSYLVNNGVVNQETGLSYSNACYRLKNGINLDGYFWVPVGVDEQGKRFSGVFDFRFYRVTKAILEDESLTTYYFNVFSVIDGGKIINLNKSNVWIIVGICGSFACIIGIALIIIWKVNHKTKKKVVVLPKNYNKEFNDVFNNKPNAPTPPAINPIDFSRFNNKKK